MSDIECPYCGHEQDVCQDDGHACEDGTVYEHECIQCQKSFALTPSIEYTFFAAKADCMNGGEHVWGRISEFKDMQARTCMACECTDRQIVTEDRPRWVNDDDVAA